MNDFNLHPDNILDPKKGRLLVSEPFMDDTYFGRTVILICEHNDEGTYGFMLNKPTEIVLGDILPDMESYKNPVGIGGPVNSDSLHYLHTAGDRIEDSEHIIENIYTSGDFETIKELLLTGQLQEHEIRFFVGYSGWEVNQLEAELLQKSWFVSELVDPNILHENEGNLWRSVLRNMGGEFRMLADFPEDPNLN